jgi:hypothetical protein
MGIISKTNNYREVKQNSLNLQRGKDRLTLQKLMTIST